MFYEDLFDRLNKDGIDYVVVGGVALVLHGVVRLTADLDLIVHLNKKNVLSFIEVMADLGYKPKAPVRAEDFADEHIRSGWIKEKNMKVFSFYHPQSAINLIDVFVEEPIDFNEMRKNSVMVKSGEIPIHIASIDNLIYLKKISARPQDLADIKALEEIQNREQG